MDIGWPELVVILAIVVLVFGTKKLPGAAKSVGQSLKIFKDETKGLRGDSDGGSDATQAQAGTTPALPAAPVTAPTDTPQVSPHA